MAIVAIRLTGTLMDMANKCALFFVIFVNFSFSASVNELQLNCSSMSLNFDDESEFGKAQYIRERPPPYRFYFLDRDEQPTKRYTQDLYSIVINCTEETYFRRFVIQAKLTTKYGFLMDHVAEGEFVEKVIPVGDEQVFMLQCSSVYNDTVMSTDGAKKFSVELSWVPKKNNGPVQFVLFIEKERDTFWSQWTPRNGLILPDSNVEFKKVARDIASNPVDKHDARSSSNDPFDKSFIEIANKENLIISTTPRSKHSINSECLNTVCQNNGICMYDRRNRNEFCSCSSGWTGEYCNVKHYCQENLCQHGGTCLNGHHGYTCQCNEGFGGRYCQFACPFNLCQNNGSCLINKANQYVCECKPGWTGLQCEIRLNDDNSGNCSATNPCLNGGTCLTLDDSYECLCTSGYMGKLCHRPCQNIYKSCESWKGEDKCESLRNLTTFFDANCAVSCEQCLFNKSTVSTDNPLPPSLEPLTFLLGIWHVDYNSSHYYPNDYVNLTNGYYEQLNFYIPNVSMFGLPTINFESNSNNKADVKDIQNRRGYIHLKNSRVSLTSIGNDGVALIEEGEIKNNEMSLTAYYVLPHPELSNSSIHIQLTRILSLKRDGLMEMSERTNNDGTTTTFLKKYGKLKSHIAY